MAGFAEDEAHFVGRFGPRLKSIDGGRRWSAGVGERQRGGGHLRVVTEAWPDPAED